MLSSSPKIVSARLRQTIAGSSRTFFGTPCLATPCELFPGKTLGPSQPFFSPYTYLTAHSLTYLTSFFPISRILPPNAEPPTFPYLLIPFTDPIHPIARQSKPALLFHLPSASTITPHKPISILRERERKITLQRKTWDATAIVAALTSPIHRLDRQIEELISETHDLEDARKSCSTHRRQPALSDSRKE
jgi:hypothetical protein